jgi:hypothetical protein
MADPKLVTVDWNSPDLIDAKQYEMKALQEAIARCNANISTYQQAISQQTGERDKMQKIVETKEMLAKMGIKTG